MKPLLTLIAAFLLISCTAMTRSMAVDPCHELTDSDDSDVSEQDVKSMMIACLEKDSVESDELAEHLKVGFLNNNKEKVEKLSEYRGPTLEFADEYFTCVLKELISTKEDLIYLYQNGVEKFFNSQEKRKLVAYCNCDTYLANKNVKYKIFYDQAGSYGCEKI